MIHYSGFKCGQEIDLKPQYCYNSLFILQFSNTFKKDKNLKENMQVNKTSEAVE